MADFETYKKIINENLDKYIEIQYPETIWKSMKYSLSAGGKRLRPVIVLDVCNTLCGKYVHAIPTACAIEMLHTYSLIHDDLPCMDNDDFRRGKPTNHKVFGEAIALLAGDALLTYAPQIIIQKTPVSVKKETVLKVLETFFVACGATGMVAGQVVDLQSEGKKIDEKTLQYMHKQKTAELFRLAFKTGGLLAEADEKTLQILDLLATNTGMAFQIADDILDVVATKEELGKTPGKDLQEQKATYVTVYGLNEAKNKLHKLCDTAEKELDKINLNSDILKELIAKIRI